MANFRQEIRQLRERFHKAVKASGGEISREEGDTNFSRYQYIVGEVVQYYIWEETFIDVKNAHSALKKLREIANALKLSMQNIRKAEIEFIVTVRDIADWESFEQSTFNAFKNIRAILEAEDLAEKRD